MAREKGIVKIPNLITAEAERDMPYLAAYTDVILNKIYEVISLPCKFFSSSRRQVPKRFNQKRHQKFRNRFKLRRRRRLPPIYENATKEMLSVSERCSPSRSSVRLSCSDRILNRLADGWNVWQSFGVHEKPAKPLQMANHGLTDRMFMKRRWRRRRPRRRLDFAALITDFLSDQVLRNECPLCANKYRL